MEEMKTEIFDGDEILMNTDLIIPTIKGEDLLNQHDDKFEIGETTLQPYIDRSTAEFPVKEEIYSQDVYHNGSIDEKLCIQNVRDKKSPFNISREDDSSILKHQCEFCNEEFDTVKLLKDHNEKCKKYQLEISTQSLRCDVCSKEFKSVATLRRHLIKTHLSKNKFKCDVCEKVFSLASKLQTHKQQVHVDNSNECDQIEKNQLKHHKQERATITTAPNKILPREDQKLKKKVVAFIKDSQKQSEPTEPPLKCDKCEERFFQPAALKLHKQVHFDEEPYECEICKEKFIRKRQWLAHQSSHSIETPLPCMHCDKKFLRTKNLNYHMRLHTNIQYKCDVCEQMFLQKDELRTHKLLHLEKRQNDCVIEPKQVKVRKRSKQVKVSLKESRRKQFEIALKESRRKKFEIALKACNNLPFECDECGRKFKTANVLRKHKYVDHKPKVNLYGTEYYYMFQKTPLVKIVDCRIECPYISSNKE